MNDTQIIEDFNTVGDTTRVVNGNTVSIGGVVIEPGPA